MKEILHTEETILEAKETTSIETEITATTDELKPLENEVPKAVSDEENKAAE